MSGRIASISPREGYQRQAGRENEAHPNLPSWLSTNLKRFFRCDLRGQVLADPDTKLVLMQTALSSDDVLDL